MPYADIGPVPGQLRWVSRRLGPRELAMAHVVGLLLVGLGCSGESAVRLLDGVAEEGSGEAGAARLVRAHDSGWFTWKAVELPGRCGVGGINRPGDRIHPGFGESDPAMYKVRVRDKVRLIRGRWEVRKVKGWRFRTLPPLP